jgi:hypothetical protein
MYGIDLGDLFRAGTRLTWRRLGVLIEHLPPESATKTALRDELDDGTLSRLASAPRQGPRALVARRAAAGGGPRLDRAADLRAVPAGGCEEREGAGADAPARCGWGEGAGHQPGGA